MRQKEWHLFLHALTGDCEFLAQSSANMGSLPLDRNNLSEPFRVTFEEMCRRVETLPGAYCEPDGAVGWNPPNCSGQYFGGTLHCIDDRVLYVELFSRLDSGNWDRLIDTLVGRAQTTVVQLAEEGEFLNLEGFRVRAFATELE